MSTERVKRLYFSQAGNDLFRWSFVLPIYFLLGYMTLVNDWRLSVLFFIGSYYLFGLKYRIVIFFEKDFFRAFYLFSGLRNINTKSIKNISIKTGLIISSVRLFIIYRDLDMDKTAIIELKSIKEACKLLNLLEGEISKDVIDIVSFKRCGVRRKEGVYYYNSTIGVSGNL